MLAVLDVPAAFTPASARVPSVSVLKPATRFTPRGVAASFVDMCHGSGHGTAHEPIRPQVPPSSASPSRPAPAAAATLGLPVCTHRSL